MPKSFLRIETIWCQTCLGEVTGKTMAENLADLPPLHAGQDVIGTFENPVKASAARWTRFEAVCMQRFVERS